MTLFGVDLSNYQAGISLAQIRQEGFDFAFCKVSQGNGYRSPDWVRQRDTARSVGLLVAGYHYADTSDPTLQARNCLAYLGGDYPVALDFEQGSGSIGNHRAVLNAFRSAGMRVVLTYLPRWYWAQIGSPSLAGFPPLWSSRYPSNAAGYASALYQSVPSSYWEGYGGLAVKVLQFSATAQVAGRKVDVNAYEGTRDSLASLLGTRPQPAPTGKGQNVLQNHRVSGVGTIRLNFPVGDKSMICARGWVSASADGPGPGIVRVYFQSDTAGISDLSWNIPVVDGLSSRVVAEIPNGTTMLNVLYTFDGGGTITLEGLAK